MISVNAKYWIWLTTALGYNNPKIKRLYELYNDISLFYTGREREWRYCGIFTENEIKKLNKKSLKDVEKIISRCEQLEYSVLSIDDDKYPKCLINIYAPPAVLYISGTLPDVDNRLTIGIVGTRKATKYGIDNSYKFGYALSKYGVATISGGALGIDCASHRGSLAADGVSICVRGCGINYDYLKENEKMRQAITKRGAVISEYPPDEKPMKYHFPARNRIISALSDGVLIIESGATSGSLITADFALEQGKDVFALLGNNSPQNEGSNNRIKEGSAIPVTDFMDILNSFDNLYVTEAEVDFDKIDFDDIEAIPVKGKKTFKAFNNKHISDNNITVESYKSKPENNKVKEKTKNNSVKEIKHKDNINVSDTARLIYEYISNEPVHIDKISSDLDIPVYRVLSSLTELEINGLVEALIGRRYILK